MILNRLRCLMSLMLWLMSQELSMVLMIML
jgi:hypothetical protein